MEGHEDEIGLAKASPFSFLPEASLLASPSLSTAATAERRGCLQTMPRRASSHGDLAVKEGLGWIVGVLSANGLLKRTQRTRLATAQAHLLRNAFLCAPAGSAIFKPPLSKGGLEGLSMSFSAKGLLFARMPLWRVMRTKLASPRRALSLRSRGAPCKKTNDLRERLPWEYFCF